MMDVRRANERGQLRLDWLDSRYSFSFANWFEPTRMGVGPLRVINEDWVEPATGFGQHGHRDMEILTWVLEGELEHADTLGQRSRLSAGHVQLMSAGTGIEHSEMNPSSDERLHLLQIWIQPDRKGLEPSYGEREVPAAQLDGRLALLASPDGASDSLRIAQDARVYASRLQPESAVELELDAARQGYLHVARGSVRVGEQELGAGDAVVLSQPGSVRVQTTQGAELLYFDLPEERAQ